MKPWPIALMGLACLVATASGQGRSPFSDPNIIVPDATAERIEGRAHTNHLIYVGPPTASSEIDALLMHGPNAAAFASGYTPAQIQGAYGQSSTGGSGAIAIVIAYHYATALNDFNVFAGTYGLPKETSTSVTASTNSVFQIVYAGASQPPKNASWNQEAALDIEWSHSMAPRAKVYLVEANSNSNADLYAAVDKAKGLPGVKCVSMSWGGPESSSEVSTDSHFTGTGVVFFASSGDTGGAISSPACSPNVVGVGGTHLVLSGNSWSSETVWTGSGCGLSSYFGTPSFQSGVTGVVGTHRGSADIGAVADPYTGCMVYDSTRYQGMSGWMVFGGTSLACPICAGIYNASGGRSTSSAAELSFIYGNSANFHDITSGTAGSFSAKSGYDLPTGVGSPTGTNSL